MITDEEITVKAFAYSATHYAEMGDDSTATGFIKALNGCRNNL